MAFTKRVYPPQIQFDNYLRSRGIIPEHFYDMRSNPLAKKLSHLQSQQSSNKVDIMRLSHNVRLNIRKEQEESAFSQSNEDENALGKDNGRHYS